MSAIKRRSFLKQAGAAAAWGYVACAQAAPAGCTLSLGTYAMPKMRVEDAIVLVGQTGYDGIELHVKEGAHACPSTLSAEHRKGIKDLINQQGLVLTSLMEHIYPSENDDEHARQLERLKHAAALAHDLAPDAPPLIQTVLGDGNWEEKKTLYVDRVGSWAETTHKTDVLLAIKPHRGGGMSQPAEAAWLIEKLGNKPWLRMVYDYSHYAFRGLSIEETVKTALPYTAHLVFKDVVQENGKALFKLPGESGAIDYEKLLRLFYAGGYRGDVCCEVSSQVWNKPDYDPAEAAKICIKNVDTAFKKAGVPRRQI